MRILLRAALFCLVVAHFAIIALIIASFFVLPFNAPWYVAVPLMVYISNLVLTRIDCPSTRLENWLRVRLGERKIGGFVGHYVKQPLMVALGIRKAR